VAALALSPGAYASTAAARAAVAESERGSGGRMTADALLAPAHWAGEGGAALEHAVALRARRGLSRASTVLLLWAWSTTVSEVAGSTLHCNINATIAHWQRA
jgi:hypothetical protein